MAEEKAINSEIRKLNKVFKNIDVNKKTIVKSLIENAAFMSVTLKDLQLVINKNGCVEEYKNGKDQYGKKKSSEVDVYNSMVKNYSAVIKQLLDLLPVDERKNADELLNFISNKK